MLIFTSSESCTKWLHVQCLGLNTQALPPVFVCMYCVQHQQQQQAQLQMHQQQMQRPIMVQPGQQIQYYNAAPMQYAMPPQMQQVQHMQPMQPMPHYL